MSKTVVELGDKVIYYTTPDQQEQMKNISSCNIQKVLPAIVVAAWSETCVNLKVFCDGYTQDFWVTSAIKGHEPGNWEFLGEWDWEKNQGRR